MISMDKGYNAVMARKNEIMKKSIGIDYDLLSAVIMLSITKK